ncbi:transcriptional regulator [Sphaerisporangium melleum]|uniref:Transcriptional regulator n=1 Tax=Sphaerisporangium melleum TaxID=321316 RepID=A0A917R2F5_9ACTN|nr:SRPBCC domain-containing protein [Sphaerisporangium melleum]GGK85686.1 transcriptional regulator [Sphaerisporangium melleum]GII71411.1 transcriptional regulator [Sphaerisporangium melleum]
MTVAQLATTVTTQVYRVYIKATPERIWDAITKPEWTARYGYTGLADYDLRPGGAYKVRPTDQFRAEAAAKGHELPDVVIEGEVLEADPPRKLVTTFHMLMDPQIAAEGTTVITHEIKELPDGVCSLTLTHELEGAPTLALIVGGRLEDQGAGGGHAWVLSDLKTLLETGKTFAE